MALLIINNSIQFKRQLRCQLQLQSNLESFKLIKDMKNSYTQGPNINGIKNVFPVPFRQTTSSEDCLSLIQDYLNNVSDLKHIFTTQHLEIIKAKRQSIKQYRFTFYEHYASILLFYQQQAFMPVSMGILYIKKLNTNAFTDGYECYEYVELPEDIGYYEIEQMQESHQPIEELHSKITQSINQTLAKLSKKQSEEKSPYFLKKIVQYTLKNQNAQQQEAPQKNKNIGLFQPNPKLLEKPDLKIDLSNQSTINFNHIIFPSIKLQLCYLLYSWIVSDEKIARTMILSFKINYLSIHLEKQSPTHRINANEYKSCLQELINQFKYLYNKQVQCNKEDAHKYFIQINKRIDKIYMEDDKKQYKISSLELSESLKAQKQCQLSQNIDIIKQYCNFTPTKLTKANDIGFVYPLFSVDSCNFTRLNQMRKQLQPKQNGEYYWVFLVEKHFYSLSQNIQAVQIDLSEIKIQNRTQLSQLHKVVNQYEEIMTNTKVNSSYSFNLKNQAYSHVYLIKYLAAAFSFQLFKRAIKTQFKLDFQIDSFTIQLDIINLYANFTSMSYLARKSLQNLSTYIDKNKNKSVLFSLNCNKNGNMHLKQLAKVMCETQKQQIQYLATKKKQLDSKIANLQLIFTGFKNRYSSKAQQLSNTKLKTCQCKYEDNLKTNYYGSQKWIVCKRCELITSLQSSINILQQEQFYQILAQTAFDADQQYLFAFFHNLRQSIGGAMKVIYEAQVPIIKRQLFSSSNRNINRTISPMQAYSQIKKASSHKLFNTVISCSRKASQFIAYQNPIVIYYYNYTSSVQIDQDLLAPGMYQPYKSLQWMIEKPNNSPEREHKVYANLDKKHGLNLKELQSMTIEQFKIYGSIRVCCKTELIILAQAILSRNVAPFTNKLHQFQRRIIMNASGNVSSFKPSPLDRILIDKNKNGQAFEPQLQLVIQSIQHLLQRYLDEWKFEDLYSLEINGFVMCLFSYLLDQPQHITKIISHAFSFYQTLKHQNKNKSYSQNKLRELYILHSIMSCFSEDVCKESSEACRIFGKIMVNYRLNKRFLQSQVNSKSIYANNIKSYQHYFNNAVLKNIQSVVKYFKTNPGYISEVILQIDEGITSDTEWKFNYDQNYTFTGINSENRYDINFFEGIVLKNGSETSRLPQKIKEDPNYIEIFGKSTNLEVYQEKNGAIRTRSNFIQHFEQEKNGKIFFQFCTAVDGVKIRMIFTNEQETRSFLFIPHAILEQQQIYIPKLYMQSYQCWIDQRDFHLIFRKKKLHSLNKISLILMHSEKGLDSDDARIITKQFQQQKLRYLTSKQHSNYFQKLFITDKDHVHNKAIDILASIEDPQYILQTYSSGYRKQTIFWLHRCGLKFVYDQISKKLISENYQGYSIPSEYRHHQLLPWKKSDDVRCLIIQKHEKSLRAATLHQYMLLLPNQQIKRNGKITIIPGQLVANQILSYQIHDSFMDIRSKARVNQLHLICLISSLSSSFKFKPLMMTNQEYCINQIRSCYSNQTLSHLQCGKVYNLINLCVQLNLNILLLCCDVLRKLTNNLKQVLAYKEGDYIYDVLSNLQKSNQVLMVCKLIYRQRYEKGLISVHNKLNKTEIALTGIDYNRLRQMEQREKLTKWHISQCFSPKFDQKTLKGLENVTQSYHKTQKDIQHLKQMLMQFFERENHEDDPEKQSKICLKLQDIISKEMFEDLQSSYVSYLRYNEKYEKLELTKQQSIKRLISFFLLPKQKCEKYKKQLSRYLQKINDKTSQHLDVITGNKTLITSKSYTDVLCNSHFLLQFYPKISKQQNSSIIKGIRQWILLTLEIQSISRILIILEERPLDKTALFRQLQSPRKEINEKNYWICFEAEMKIRIWLSQYDTYQHLRNSQSGSVSQLNMGEGKTQVIIPMIVLDNLYDSAYKNPISRINILSSLFKQAQANYFRFLSMTSFRIPIFSWLFNRQVQLTRQNINKIKFMIYLLKQKMLMLLDRESCLSMVLKIREEVINQSQSIQSIGKYRDEWIFEGYQIYDIFDEVDALMTSKKSFVYSVGASSDLPDARLRFELARIIMEIISVELLGWLINYKFVIIDETLQIAIQSVMKGGYPRGLRLKQNLSKGQILDLRQKIVSTLLQNEKYCPPQFKFYENLSNKQKQVLIGYLIDETTDNIKQIQDSLPQDMNQIFAVRGLIAFGILEHCLKMRNGVDFGVPGAEHPKQLGVPYEAGDLPSKRSQFSHPDVSIFISYISYFVKGISLQQFQNVLYLLLHKSQSAKRYNYGLWYSIIFDDKFRPTDVCEAKQINLDSPAQIQYLFEKYRFNRNVIVFWLVNNIFPTDLRQFNSSITSSCYDIAHVQKSIGFSGTKDTRWLNPSYIHWKPSSNDAINGTDGKMIHLMVNHTRSILTINDGTQSLWERFCQQVLQLQDDNVGSIIDAGAILVGKSFERQIIPWIVKNPLFKKHKFRGITFCDENGKWKVYDTTTLSVIERGTSIPEHQTFVIFDEARTRGADLKMGSHVRAVLSLSPNMTKDKLMQAVGRLRKFGRHQQIYIMATSEIIQKIKGISVNDLKQKIRKVIEWTCENSLEDNRHTLFSNSRLGQIHLKTILSEYPDVQTFNSSLKSLYSGKISEKSVYEIYKISIDSKFDEKMIKTQQIEALSQKIKLYGSDYVIKSYDFDDVCQRQVEFVVETEKIVINEHDQLTPQQETNVIQMFDGAISSTSFKFSKKLRFSKNFINCTNKNFSIFGNSQQCNQLSNINFFLCQNGQIRIITQRQMCLQLQRKTPCLGHQQLSILDSFNGKFVGIFKDLSKQTPIVRTYQLEDAITHAQFFNGNQFFDHRGKQILNSLVKNCLRQPQQVKLHVPVPSIFRGAQALFGLNNKLLAKPKPAEISKFVDIEKLVSHFLIRRRTYQAKFVSSDLEKVTVQLKSIPEKQLQPPK